MQRYEVRRERRADYSRAKQGDKQNDCITCRFDFVAAPSSPGRGHRTPPLGWSGNVWVTRARTVTDRSAYKREAGTVRHCHYLTGALRSGATLTTILQNAAQWDSVFTASNGGKIGIGFAIFTRLFELVPAAKGLFSGVNVDDMRSPEFSAQTVRVMTGLDISINALNDQALLESLTGHLSSQHAVRPGVTAAGFQVMEDVILEIMPQLIDNFNPDAWTNCLNVIIENISAGLA
ncbi:Extracellular giant hemoglobin major globin subunit B2 [Lamellibrachia satsuma]|nr:Extracellular giant hemoglobin major globin subunit B2 [Lamellibrachia satsuma]